MRKLAYMFIIILLFYDGVLSLRQCNTTDLRRGSCFATEMCVENSPNGSTGYCDCKIGYKRFNNTFCNLINGTGDDTTSPSTSSLVNNGKSTHIAVAVTVTLLLIALVICGIYFTNRYKLVAWVRNKVNQRNNNYDEVMIGQDLDDDDPPLH